MNKNLDILENLDIPEAPCTPEIESVAYYEYFAIYPQTTSFEFKIRKG